MIKKYILLIVSAAFMSVACQKELSDNPTKAYVSDVTFLAINETEDAAVRSSLQEASEGVYSVRWNENDQVFVSDGENYTAYSAAPSAENPLQATLTTGEEDTPSKDAQKYYAVYPADDAASVDSKGYVVVIPTNPVFKGEEVVIPRVGFSGPERNLKFKNAASILKIVPSNYCDSYDGVKIKKIEVISERENIAGPMTFTYDGQGEPVLVKRETGSRKIVLNCGEGASFDDTFYVAIAPGTYVGGLTVKIYSNGTGSQTFVIPGDKLYARSRYSTVKCKVTDLSIFETANCYLVKRTGTYKFPVNIKGNGNNVLLVNTHTGAGDSDDSSTKVTYSTPEIDVTTIAGVDKTVISQKGRTTDLDLNLTMKDVVLDGDYISFTVPENFVPGNVHIGVYPNEECTPGTCIWSWHIWVNSEVADVDTGVWHKDFGGNVFLLNMNLGSLQTVAELGSYAEYESGLYYQWGRKDPFPPGNSSSVELPEGYSLDVDLDKTTERRVKYSKGIAYPKVFYSGVEDGSANRAWFNGSEFFKNEVYANFWGAEPSHADPLKASNTVVKTMFDPCPPGYHVISAFGLKSIAYDASSKLNDMIFCDPDGYMYHKRDTDLILPYDGCRTPGSKNTYASRASKLWDVGKKPYYWCASYFNKKGMDGLAMQFTTADVKEKKDAVETTSKTVAGPVKLSKSYACSVRAQKQM